MIQIQYDLFKDEKDCELDAIRLALNEYKLSSDKVRRGLYAKNSAQDKRLFDVESRLEILERNICQGKI